MTRISHIVFALNLLVVAIASSPDVHAAGAESKEHSALRNYIAEGIQLLPNTIQSAAVMALNAGREVDFQDHLAALSLSNNPMIPVNDAVAAFADFIYDSAEPGEVFKRAERIDAVRDRLARILKPYPIQRDMAEQYLTDAANMVRARHREMISRIGGSIAENLGYSGVSAMEVLAEFSRSREPAAAYAFSADPAIEQLERTVSFRDLRRSSIGDNGQELVDAMWNDKFHDYMGGNPFASLRLMGPIGLVLGRGVAEFTRTIYRTEENPRAGYDYVRYDIIHPDKTRSVINAFKRSKPAYDVAILSATGRINVAMDWGAGAEGDGRPVYLTVYASNGGGRMTFYRYEDGVLQENVPMGLEEGLSMADGLTSTLIRNGKLTKLDPL